MVGAPRAETVGRGGPGMSGDADFDEAVDVSDEVASDEDDERTPESVVPPASSPGWKAPSVGDLFADDDDDSDSDGEGMLGRDTASRLNGLLNHRSLGSANSNRPTGAAAIAGAPPALKPLGGARLGGAGMGATASLGSLKGKPSLVGGAGAHSWR